MNTFSVFALKCLRGVYQRFHTLESTRMIPFSDKEDGAQLIFRLLSSEEPCMIARYGAYELLTVLNYLGVSQPKHSYIRYIKGETTEWWWNRKIMEAMQSNAGFFPPTEDKLSHYSHMMIEDSRLLDVLAVYLSTRSIIPKFEKYIPNKVHYIPSISLDSFISMHPWTKALLKKRVLVISPFAELIEKQYKKRTLLFDNKDVLPEFQLRTIKAVQSLGGDDNGYADWFEALDWMKKEMDKAPYDIALIGCGAYGFPLAAHAKRTGHKSVHIGGTLQLLFGIKGKRWENPIHGTHLGIPEGFYKKLMENPEWVSPEEYRTIHTDKVENGCYW